jgi:FMN-dependent NADH-azoreductase
MKNIERSPSRARLNILRVDASGRTEGSSTRALTGALVDGLSGRFEAVSVVERDLSEGVPLIDAAWIDANFTDESERTAAHRDALAISDTLVDEIEKADILVIGVPIYNFSVPAALKAWIDMVARARRTFRYTDDGPIGLLSNKKAYLAIASGGVPVDGAVDFATPYMRHVLGFLGITDVEVIAADRQNAVGEAALEKARRCVDALVERAEEHARAAA